MALVTRLSLLTCAAALIGGCGDDDDEPARNPPNKAVEATQLGETAILERGSNFDGKLAATAVRVLDPVPEHAFEDARISGRFVGVVFRLANRGDVAYRGSPWSGARLSTTKGGERPTKLLKQGTCIGTTRLVLSPGGSEQICIPFRVEKDAKPLRFRYAPQGGFAPAAAVWDLR